MDCDDSSPHSLALANDLSNNLCPAKRKATSQKPSDVHETTGNSENTGTSEDNEYSGVGHVLLYRQARVYLALSVTHQPIEDGNEVDMSNTNVKIVELINDNYPNSKNIILEINHTPLCNNKCHTEVTFIGIDDKIIQQLKQTSMTKFIFYIGLQEITKESSRTELSVFNGHPHDSQIAFNNKLGIRLPYMTGVIDITELNLK